MSFNRITWMALIALASCGGALACGPFFPWQVFDDRARTMAAPIELDFKFEVSRLAPPPRDGLAVVEPPPKAYGQPDEPQVLAVERQEASSGSWLELVADKPKAEGLDWARPETVAARLAAARGATDGPAVLVAGAGLPDSVLDYIAGATEFTAKRLDDAEKYFSAIDRLPQEQRTIRAVWAAFMLGRVYQYKGDMAAARAAFQRTRAEARAGAPDPLGLAVASLGEEARVDLIVAGLIEWPTYSAGDTDDVRSDGMTAEAVQLYAEQAARGSKIAVLSLRDVAAALLKDPDALSSAVAAPLVRRVLVAYVITMSDYNFYTLRYYPPSSYDGATALMEAVSNLPDPVAGDDVDRLATLAYQAGKYDVAERLLVKTDRPLGLWVRAKLALRRGDKAQAVRDWSAALAATSAAASDARLDDGATTRLRGEAAVAKVMGGDYRESLQMLFPAAKTYWGDVTYVAERLMTVDELKSFVDGLPPPAPTVEKQPDEDNDFFYAFTNDPAGSLRYLLARRLVREGRIREAEAYFTKVPTGVLIDVPKEEDFAKTRSDYSDLLGAEASVQTWPWQGVSRAETRFKLAKLVREHGMALMGTEGPPDVTAVAGSFSFGAGQAELPKEKDMLGPDEAARFAASAPKPNSRFHYRIVASEWAVQAADLLPSRSQAYAATLCWAAAYAKDGADLPRMKDIYRRYVATGAYQDWAAHFPPKIGDSCPDPDFDGARHYWLHRTLAWTAKQAAAAQRHWLLVAAGVVVLAGAFWAVRRYLARPLARTG
jgi:hypothetical protein